MVTVTHNNHFKFGYNNGHFNKRESLSDSWTTSYGTITKDRWVFRDECKNTARIIDQTTDKPIFVAMSGGHDSEVVANSFLSQGIQITPVIARYNDGMNDYDTTNAFKWCEYKGITPRIFDIDVLGFWESQYAIDMALEFNCISPQFLIYMQIIEKINSLGGFPVFGSAECYLENNALPTHMFEREKVASMYRYCIDMNISSAIGFFQYTPDIMYSFLKDYFIEMKVNEASFSTSKEFKYLFYRQHFDVTPRNSTSGFEKIWEADKVLRDRLIDLMPNSDTVNKHDYNNLVSALEGK